MFMVRIKKLAPLLSLVFFAVALWVVHGVLATHQIDDIIGQFGRLSARQITWAVVLTTASYVLLTLYDYLALAHVGQRLGYGKIVLGSFVSYVFAHNIGLSLLTGGTIRYRIYSAEGLSAVEIATVTSLCAMTFAIGASLLTGFALLLEPDQVLSLIPLPNDLLRAIGLAVLVAIAAYVGWTARRKAPFRFRQWEIAPPPLTLTLRQMVLSSADILLAAGALYALLPAANISFIAFVGVYVLAIVAGVASHVPGGLGVVEAVVLLLVPDVPRDALLASLVAYRLIYYILPLLLAALLLAGYEVSRLRTPFGSAGGVVSQVAARATPPVLGSLVLLGGAVLLISGATPGVESRLDFLAETLPLPLVEGSHLLGSLTGFALLVLARGIFRRLDVAFHLTVVLLVAGIVFSLLKGLDYEEAIFLSVILVALVAGRRAFYRPSSLLSLTFTPAWVATIAILIIGSVWLGLFCYKEVDYAHDLWWQFAFDADAPRFLRASFLVVLATVIFSLSRLLRAHPTPPARPTAEDLQRAKEIAARSPSTMANLALMGDKYLLFNDAGDSFIMYGIQGRSWVALGDPVGNGNERLELLWRFREYCDRLDGRPVFYQVEADSLSLYVDLGLSLFKLGHEARVPLSGFSLDGKDRKDVRYEHRRAGKQGARFRMLAVEEVVTVIPQLGYISDAWMTAKKAQEKGFSLGRFAPGYIANFPCGVVEVEDRIVAFANVWIGADHYELSVDLMRYLPDAPKGIMDFLFVELMLWGRDQGFEWFSLGMAPLSDLEAHPLASPWHHLGRFVFRHGEHFYSFEGLRRYKEKFHPVWQPRYLACPNGLAVVPALMDVMGLISGRLLGVIPK